MNNHKIVFTGPVGAGKSTAIATLSDIPPISMNRAVSNLVSERKAVTRAALDYGIMHLDGGEHLHLVGISDQDHFDTMWNIFINGGVGLVLLINNSAADPFRELHFFLESFDRFTDQTRVVIGITRMDEYQYPTIVDYHLQLAETKYNIPIFEVDARERRDIALLVEALLYTLDPRLVA